MTKELRVRARGVEGIEGEARATLRVGVNELRGSNGRGKSSFGRAIAARMGVSTVEVNVTAGGFGEVEIEGALMVVKPAGRRTKLEELGPAPAVAVDREPLETLITADGVGTPALANDRRVKALARLYPMPVDEAALREMIGDDPDVWEAVKAWRGQELPNVVEGVRTALNKAALEADREVTAADAAVANLAEEAEGKLREVGGRQALTSSSPAEARQEVERLVSHVDRIEDEHGQRLALERQQAEIRAADDPEPDHAGAARALEEATEQVDRGQARIADLRRQLQDAERAQGDLERAQERAAGEERRAREAHEAWARRREILSKPVTGPTERELEAARRELADAREVERLARLSAEYRDIIRRSEEKQGERVRLKQREGRLRGLVKALAARAGDLLAKAGIPDTRIATGEDGVEPGRLCAVLEDGRVVDVNERMVSAGQLVRWALRVAEPRMPAAAFLNLVPLSNQEKNWWADLDGRRRRELADIFLAHSLVVDVELPSEEEEEVPLHIVHLPSGDRTPVEIVP